MIVQAGPLLQRVKDHTRACDARSARHRPQRSEAARMPVEENVQTAKEGYAAFGRGDVPAILELLADDIEWIEPRPPDSTVDPGPADISPGAEAHRAGRAAPPAPRPSSHLRRACIAAHMTGRPAA